MSTRQTPSEDKSQVIQSFPEIADWDANFDITGLNVKNANFEVAQLTNTTVKNLTVTGQVVMSAGDLNLGDVRTVHIGGGSSGQVLTTNGAGGLSWTQSGGGSGNGTVTSVGLTSTSLTIQGSPVTTSGVIKLEIPNQPGITPGTYNNSTVTVDQQGRVTGISNGTPAVTGVTSVGIQSSTLAVQGSPVTSTGDITVNLVSTGVAPGSYSLANITVDSQGRITAASNGSAGTGTVTSVSIDGGPGISISGSPITSAGTITIENTGLHAITPGENIRVAGTQNNPIISSVQEYNYARFHSNDHTALEAKTGDEEVYLTGNVAPNYSVGDRIIWDSIPNVEFTITHSANTLPGPSGFVTEDLGIGWGHPFIRIMGTDVLPYIPNGSKLCLKATDPERPSPMWDRQEWWEIKDGRVVHDYHNIDYATQYDSVSANLWFSGYGVNDVYVAFPDGRTTLTLDQPLPQDLPANSTFTILKRFRDVQFSSDFDVSVANGVLQIALKK